MHVRYYEKKPGHWWLDFRDPEGKRRRVPSGCSTEAAARKASPGIIAEALRAPAVSLVPATATVPAPAAAGTALKDAYKRTKGERKEWLQAKDKAGLEGRYEAVAAYWGEDRDMGAFTREAVLQWRADMLASPGKRAGTTLSPSTINQRLSLVSVLLEACNLPPHTVKHLSVEGNRRKRRVREEELQAMQAWLLAHHSDRRGAASLADLITVALHTTARQGELLALEWRDVYFDRGVLMYRDPKNGTFREGLLTDAAKRVLERRMGYGLKGPFHDLDKDRCADLWDQGRKAIGLGDDPEFVFHVATRHEGLSRAGETGANTFLIKALGGHKSTQTSDRYVKPGVQAQRALVEAIANYRPGT